MVRELLIMRHGQAKKAHGSDDQDRPLKDKGKRNAQRMGTLLWVQGLRPDCVLSSPAERALNTAEKCVKAAGLRADLIKKHGDIYQGHSDNLLAQLQKTGDWAARLLLVGHNPGLEDLVKRLCNHRVDIKPATLVRLSVNSLWRDLVPKSCELLEVITPDDLNPGFPFPMPLGKEKRPRPSYYYRQSAVVPVRRHGGALQVLVVSSSGQKHLVVPKGIHDSGLTAQESAAKEAMEEAGVKGRVLENPIGVYHPIKWEAPCEVTVYPMVVDEEIAVADWEESHRGRRWVSVEEASSLVHNQDLSAMIAALPDALKKAGDF